MKHRNTIRILSLLLCLALCLSLLGGVSVFAAEEIWTEPPTGWNHWSHVLSKQSPEGYTLNWGVRGEPALFLSGDALSYYADNEWGVEMAWGYFALSDYEGGSGAADAPASPLYGFLHDFLAGKQTHETSYAETRDLYRYTDCMASNSDYISSFYSGVRLNGAWDTASWNREHTWPKSKSTGSQENDIMMLRPTAISENSARGNLAYGESQGFYNPNAEAGGRFDLRGDCARICLYCYVRWSENAENMWGAGGVVESLDVLLDWMEQDPVDTWEMGRNDAVQSITGVRNCFVDYPELAWALFGRECPAGYPTPMNGGDEWPPASAVMTEFEAVPDDPAHGSVTVRGLCADLQPAEGYYASGYDVLSTGPWYIDPAAEDPYADLLHWDRGRLLCMGQRELDVSVVIHFTPVGQTDPCPAGHKWGEGVVVKEATVDQDGALRYTCARCGKTRTETVAFAFADVEYGKYYYEPVYWALRHEPRITSGTDATHFSPKKTCTREQVVSFLWAAMGKPEPETPADAAHNPFADVKPSAYYYKAVLWAVENGVTSGIDATHFAPKKGCTREQVAAFLWTLAGKPDPLGSESPFTDVIPGKYYFKPVLWAVENGVTEGMGGGKFGVGKTCTRAQIVTFLYKAMTNPELEFCHHSYTVESGSPATCTKAATERRTCTRCGYSFTRSVGSPLGHELRFVRSYARNATEDGFDLYACDRCGAEVRENIQPSIPGMSDLRAVIEYGLQYAQSLGYTIDRTMTPKDSSYYPGYLSNTKYFPESQDDLKRMTIGLINGTTDELIAGGDTIPGFRCNIYASYNMDYCGEYYIIFLYG